MYNISRLIIWICKRFTREQIERIIQELVRILKDSNSEIKPRDKFKEEHPHYREFYVDPEEPLEEKPDAKKKRQSTTK